MTDGYRPAITGCQETDVPESQSFGRQESETVRPSAPHSTAWSPNYSERQAPVETGSCRALESTGSSTAFNSELVRA